MKPKPLLSFTYSCPSLSDVEMVREESTGFFSPESKIHIRSHCTYILQTFLWDKNLIPPHRQSTPQGAHSSSLLSSPQGAHSCRLLSSLQRAHSCHLLCPPQGAHPCKFSSSSQGAHPCRLLSSPQRGHLCRLLSPSPL